MSEEELSTIVDDAIVLDDAPVEEEQAVSVVVFGIPEKIEYGAMYKLSTIGKLVFVDKNGNEIVKIEGSEIVIPEFYSRLAKNFPQGDYKLYVGESTTAYSLKFTAEKHPQ